MEKLETLVVFFSTSVELSYFDILDTFIRLRWLTISKPTLDTATATISFLSNSKQFWTQIVQSTVEIMTIPRQICIKRLIMTTPDVLLIVATSYLLKSFVQCKERCVI